MDWIPVPPSLSVVLASSFPFAGYADSVLTQEHNHCTQRISRMHKVCQQPSLGSWTLARFSDDRRTDPSIRFRQILDMIDRRSLHYCFRLHHMLATISALSGSDPSDTSSMPPQPNRFDIRPRNRTIQIIEHRCQEKAKPRR